MRIPKSQSELRSSGSYRADRHKNRGETVSFAPGIPPRPEDLSAGAIAAWDSLSALLANVLTEADGPALRLLAETTADDRAMSNSLAKLLPGSTEWKRCADRQHQNRKLMASLLARFGMSPSDRGKVKVHPAPPKPPEPKDSENRVLKIAN